eukprot:5854647-Pyramimonas_sp.AAC.1
MPRQRGAPASTAEGPNLQCASQVSLDQYDAERKLSFAKVRVDIVGAFCSVQRQLVADLVASDEASVALLQRLGLGPEARARLA